MAREAAWCVVAKPISSARRFSGKRAPTARSSFGARSIGTRWVDEGSSWVASDVLAAILRVQINRLPDLLARKRALAQRLTERLAHVADRVVLPRLWDDIESTWHLYPVLVEPTLRDDVIAALRAEGIGAAFHYIPLHSSP